MYFKLYFNISPKSYDSFGIHVNIVFRGYGYISVKWNIVASL